MSLREYARKRRFGQTPEPAGADGATGDPGRPRFVVQLHHARARHYDFRLEVDGALRSWAVPRGPSLRPSDRRLAVEVEDHPLDYADFEGEIPAGNYGAGDVRIFDRGHWSCAGDPLAALAAGSLDFELHGERLAGAWKLVRTSRQSRQRQWLLIKRDDAHAADLEADDLVDAAPGKATKGKAAKRAAAVDAAAGGSARPHRHGGAAALRWRDRALALAGAAAPMPVGFAPQLATARDRPPAGADWLHEVKWDGYRMMVDLVGGRPRLRSRGGLDWTADFPTLVAAMQALPVADACLDGELVVLDDSGRADFAALQRHLEGAARARLHYIVFDLPGLAGVDLRDAGLQARKALLAGLLADPPAPLRFGDHLRGDGAALHRATAEHGVEGVVSKRADAPYRAGRGDDWIKTRHVRSDEFVVVGHTPPQGSRSGFGSLLLASQGGTGLRYMGRVGSGFDEATLRGLQRRLETLAREAPVLELPAHVPFPARSVRWVQPRLVAEVAYRGHGKEGLLRQASFRRLRPDKRPADTAPAPPTRGQEAAMAISHPSRRMFAGAEYSKQDVADYYAAVADRLLAEIAGRPLSLLRCPDGRDGECFFQKHHADSLGRHVHPVTLRQKDGKADYLYVDSPEGLLELVQMNVVELHPWGSRIDQPERPDRLVFDLDPGPGVDWPTLVGAAREVRDRLRDTGLESAVRLTGGKGLHVVAAIGRGPGWDEVRGFCEAFASAMAAQSPERYVATMSKARRRGRIFIDWLRNGRGATAIASWSLRARPGAPVAVPLRWADLGRVAGSDAYDLAAARNRARRLAGDPWVDMLARPQSLPRLD